MEHDEAVTLIRPGVGAPGETWADLGAGSGVFTVVLSALLGLSGTVYAVDRDARAVEQLRAVRTLGATIHVRQADLTQPLGLTGLGGMLLANALHFVVRQERALIGLAGTLRPGGRLLVVEYDTRQRTPWGPFPVPPERLRELTRASGFGYPKEIGRRPSRFGGRELYAAVAVKR